MKNILILLVVAFLLRLFLAYSLPFMGDEAVYAMIITEGNIFPVPEFFGEDAGWKPPLLFFFASIPFNILKGFLPLELSFRFFTLLVSVANLLLLFKLIEKHADRDVAFLTVFFYAFNILITFMDSLLMTDTLLMFFILSSLLFYTGKQGRGNFLIAGGLSFLAFYTKSIFAFLIPFVSSAYWLAKDKNVFFSKSFLLSLMFVPLAFILYFLSFESLEKSFGIFVGDEISKLYKSQSFLSGYLTIIVYIVFFIFLAMPLVVGIKNYWRKHPWMFFWLLALVIIIPASRSGLFWYPMSIFPSLCFFSALYTKDNLQKGTLRWIVLGVYFLICIISVYYFFIYLSADKAEEREVGYLMIGKENVLFIGDPNTESVGYKVVNERLRDEEKDFGWVMFLLELNNTNYTFYTDYIDKFIEDYEYSDENVEKDFTTMYWTDKKIVKKESALSKFDYIVLTLDEEKREDIKINGEYIYYGKEIAVWHIRE